MKTLFQYTRVRNFGPEPEGNQNEHQDDDIILLIILLPGGIFLVAPSSFLPVSSWFSSLPSRK